MGTLDPRQAHGTRGGSRLPQRKPDLATLGANRSEPTVTWIGHATAQLQLGGLNILTDPHSSARGAFEHGETRAIPSSPDA